MMRYSPRLQRALFALDRMLGPFGLVLVTTLDGDFDRGFRVTRLRLALRRDFLPGA